jgi:hypothetical protein
MMTLPWLECSAPVGSSASSSAGREITGARHRHELLLPAESWFGIEVLLAHDLEAVEDVGDARLALARRDVAVAQRQVEVLRHRQVVDQVVVLEDEADLVALQRLALFRVERVHGVPSSQYSPSNSESISPSTFNSELLPAPEGPMMLTNSPAGPRC